MADDARPDLIERLLARVPPEDVQWCPWCEGLEGDHRGNCFAQLIREAAEALTAERELCEKYRIAATVMCGAHIGVPQDSCPVCALTAERSRREQAEQERDKWLDAFNRSEQFQNGPTKRAEAAEAREQSLRAALDALANKWAEQGVMMDSVHATMGIGYKACAEELRALAGLPSQHASVNVDGR